jgi:hypothetical protein
MENKMKLTKKLSLSEIAENQTDFEISDYQDYVIGSLENGQIVCLFDDICSYIALINPQDQNYLFFADEFPSDDFSQKTLNKINKIFDEYLIPFGS